MLTGQVAIVTGGTRGIGFSIVQKYLENGAKVVLLGSRQETVDHAIETLRQQNGEFEVEGLCPNLKDPAQMKEMVDTIHEKYGRIDILVNNAGVSDSGPSYDCDPAHFADVMDLNVNALFNAIQPCIGYMKEQGSGCIINMSSMVTKLGQSAGVSYPASKFAVNGLTVSLARELGPDNIRVNAVAPGITQTDMLAQAPQEYLNQLIQMIPMRRIGKPEDIANACLYLASDLASYVTGTIINVDGAMIV